MQRLETQFALRAWAWPVVRSECGQDSVAVEVDLLRQDQVFRAKKRRTL